MAYSADTFVADEVPTTAKWNKLWSNDASMHDGTGIDDDVILERHINTGVLIENFHYQTDNNNSIASTTDAKIQLQAGWGQATGDNVNPYFEISVTLPQAFTTILGAAASLLPVKTSAAASITAFDVDYTTVIANASIAAPISNSGFNILLQRASGIFSNSTYYGYSWVAWGIV